MAAAPRTRKGDIERALPALGPLEFVDSGGWKDVYQFHHGGSTWALMIVPLPNPEEVPDQRELDEICAQVRSRVRREIRIMRRVSTANMVKLGPFIDAQDIPNEGQLDNRSFLWFTEEFLQGESIAKRIQRADRPDPFGLARMLLSMLNCVQAFKDLRVVHRDIKPSNIMVLPDPGAERFVLLDAGVAYDEAGTPLTSPWQRMGTTRYMSPEQIKNETLDWRSDLFSLGVSAYEYATGHHPFVEGGVTRREMETRILLAVPVAMRELRPDLPEGFSAVLAAILKKKPHLRMGNIATLRERISDAVEGR
jgi:serine/threonine protein kinase